MEKSTTPENNMVVLANGIELTTNTVRSLMSDNKVSNFFGSKISTTAISTAFINAVRDKVYSGRKA